VSADRVFPLFVGAWIALAVGAALLSRASLATKRRWHPRLVVGSSILLVGFASLIVPASYTILLVAPAACLIAFLNLRMTKFCASCGSTSFARGFPSAMRFCQACGASLDDGSAPRRTTIHHRVAIEAPVAKVYAALSSAESIGTWWDAQTPIQSARGLVLEHDPGPAHGKVQLRVVDLVPGKRVEWECISTHPQTSPASAWTGTHFVFDLTGRDGGGATLDFRQTGYPEDSPFFGSNNFAWSQVLANLKRVVEGSVTQGA
jgi:uncharacterized protein YndB with AHSA1/START domain